jgi:hypothetical protein
MRRLLVLSAMLAAFAWCATSYGVTSTRVLVYKGTIKAAKTIFDVNDTNNLLSGSIQGYWAVRVIDTGVSKGFVVDSNAVVYNTKGKNYKVIPDSVSTDPYDPCHVVLLSFTAEDTEGELGFYVVGKGHLTKFTNNPGTAKDFVPTNMKGAGFISNYDFFDPNYADSGTATVSMILDSALTRKANSDANTVDGVINNVVSQLTHKGGWRNWPYIPAPPP